MMDNKNFQVTFESDGTQTIAKGDKRITVTNGSIEAIFANFKFVREALFASRAASVPGESLTINGITGKAVILLAIYFLITGFFINSVLGQHGMALMQLSNTSIARIYDVFIHGAVSGNKGILLLVGTVAYFGSGVLLFKLESRAVMNADVHILKWISIGGVAIFSFLCINGIGLLTLILLPLPTITFLVIAGIYEFRLLRYDQDLALIILSGLVSAVLMFVAFDLFIFGHFALTDAFYAGLINHSQGHLYGLAKSAAEIFLMLSMLFALFLNMLFNSFEDDEAASMDKEIEWQRALIVFYALIFMVLMMIAILFRSLSKNEGK